MGRIPCICMEVRHRMAHLSRNSLDWLKVCSIIKGFNSNELALVILARLGYSFLSPSVLVVLMYFIIIINYISACLYLYKESQILAGKIVMKFYIKNNTVY